MPVEEQTQYNYSDTLYSTWNHRFGQRLTIANRKVTKLGFWLHKEGSPTGDVTLEIRKVSDDSLICSKVWGDAGDIPTETTYEEVTFDTPTLINEEVRIDTRFVGGDSSNRVHIHGQMADVKANEKITYYKSGNWTDYDGYDCAYRYTYPVPGASPARQQMATFLRR